VNGQEEEILRQISNQLGDLLAMYRLVNRERIIRGRDDVLGDGTKRKLWESCDGLRTQAELAKAAGVTQQRVSQIVSELADAGMIARNADGKWARRLES
jgi:DNA-binding MarR family transcriptional regulator